MVRFVPVERLTLPPATTVIVQAMREGVRRDIERESSRLMQKKEAARQAKAR